MAGRLQNTHDGGIVERRLRPIYDWLDNGNNKKALQEAEKVLKKSPSLQSARALKALALLRLGRGPEAHAVLDALAEEKPSDDTTLQAMTISYRESQQLAKVCALYEAAVKAEPASEELHSHLFMSYVRVGDYRAQQRAAMALYKFAPKNPYYFWAVMSIVLQAEESEDKTKRGILLALAQRMVDNFITEKKMEAEQEARLYVMILERQEKWEEILSFIESPLYFQLVPGTPGSPAQECIPYLKKLGQWRRINFICKNLLLEHPDRWDYYIPYLESVFKLMKVKDQEVDEMIDNTPEKAHEFICQLLESMGNGKTLRGPFLARLELYKRLTEHGLDTTVLGSGVALCEQYLRVFAHKPCAVPDLRPYLSMLTQKEREENCQTFLTCMGFDENSEPNNSDDIQRHISCMAMWRLTAPPLSADQCLKLATTLKNHYLRCLRDGLVTSTLTEFCAADGYGILAAHHYFYAATQQQSVAPVLEALSLLELLLHHSPANFHAKLLLITLYHLLGHALAADTIYTRLEIKHVQLVSLGWLHAARLPTSAPSRALQLLADTRAFHTHHAKDSVEHLTYAYKYGTFEKLVELYAWWRRLEACAWGALAARLQTTLATLAGPAAKLIAPTRLPSHPTDNRDLNVIVNYEPPQCQDPELKSRTFDQDLAYIRLKDGLICAIALCIELSDSRPLEQKRQQYEELKICIEAFSNGMERCRDKYNVKERISISAPFPSRIVAFVTSPVQYSALYSTTLSMVGELSMQHTSTAQELCSRVCALIASAEDVLKTEGVGEDDKWSARERMECLSNYLEFIGIITYLLGVCNDLITPTNTKKSKKKTTHSPDEIKTHELLNKLNETVQKSINYLEGIFENWPTYDDVDSLEDDFKTLSSENKDFKYTCPVLKKLRNSRADMLMDLNNILKRKCKYLQSLVH